jgi:hypothetical protein
VSVTGSVQANGPRLPDGSGTTDWEAAAVEVAAADWPLADGRLLERLEALGETPGPPHPASRTQASAIAALLMWRPLAGSAIKFTRSRRGA